MLKLTLSKLQTIIDILQHPSKSWIRKLLLFSHSVMSNSLRPHELQLARPPCPSPTLGVYSNSCPLSQWCHPTISSSVIPSPVFNLSQYQGLFQWVSPSHQVAKVLQFFSFRISPSNKYSGLVSFRMDWLDVLAVQGILKSLRQYHSSKYQLFGAQLLYGPTLTSIHDYWKNHSFD